MDERREKIAAFLSALNDEQVRLVEDYARSLRDLDAALEAYHALEELWKSRPGHAEPLGPPVS